jgi:hypothetical protein
MTRSLKHNFDFLFLLKYLSKFERCIVLQKYFAKQIYSYSFHISKLNNLKVLYDLCFQYLTKILSKTSNLF